MKQKELICIGCPLGCRITVKMDQGEVKEVTGYTCVRGEEYARKEVLNPTRIVTSTVNVEGGDIHILPVKTKEDIQKDKIFQVIEELKEVTVKAPVQIGDPVLLNAAGTGVPVVATKEVK